MPAVEIDLMGNVVTPSGGGPAGLGPTGGGGGGGGPAPAPFTTGQRITAGAVIAALAANAVGNKIISYQNKRDITAALKRVEGELQALQVADPSLGILLEFRFKGGADSGEGPTAEPRFQGLGWQRARSESEARAKFKSSDVSLTAQYSWTPPLLGGRRTWKRSPAAHRCASCFRFAGYARRLILKPPSCANPRRRNSILATSANLANPPSSQSDPGAKVAYRGVRGGEETNSLTLANRDVVDGNVRAIMIDGTPVVPILAADQQTAAFFRADAELALDDSGVVREVNIDQIRWVRPEQIEMVNGSTTRFVDWTKKHPNWEDLPFPKTAPVGDPKSFEWDHYKDRWVQKKR